MIYEFSSIIYEDETNVVQKLLDTIEWDDVTVRQVRDNAIALVKKARTQKGKTGQLEAFLQEFSLNTEEGLAMMCLAEALLRIPDAKTANALIKDRVVAANWLQSQGANSKDWMAKAAGVGMALTRKTLDSSLSKLGEPVIREAMIKAMQMMGKQFVVGVDIDDALSNAKIQERQGYRMSYDMLGEGARDQDTADRYFDAYMNSIEMIAVKNQKHPENKAGISVKLSALHPRYHYSQKARCIPEISEKLKALCISAAEHGMPLTVDAEECNRLDLSIEIFLNVLDAPEFQNWEGFGLAVQAYQKRALPLIEYLAKQVRERGRKIQVRLVKGAYWDSEIKHAQIHGMPEYPVYTRKYNTDLSYLRCAQEMLKNADVFYPMFATHNAHTIAAIKYMSQKEDAVFEFQRLHGMGESLYAQVISAGDVRVSVYAPVGPHRDLLPYLVRRLLENGANSSFVNQLLDDKVSPEDIVCDPVGRVREFDSIRHPKIPLPLNLFGDYRKNSKGIDFDDPASSQDVVEYIASFKSDMSERSIVNGQEFDNPDGVDLDQLFKTAHSAHKSWNKKDVQERSAIIERFADLLEDNAKELMAILSHEAGKTILDARDELREAVDFCHYYAANARKEFNPKGVMMPGYTGESNRLTLQGRGVFVCISPWNFPLAIFTGQIIAALAAGNAVLAKPASQTRYIATRTIQLMHQAGIPADLLHLLCGNGAFGSKMIENKGVSGVAFTGSTVTAKHIQRSLAEHNDAIVPFIAETGGQNAMIVDSSALAEQIVDDVVLSAFGSAGQRCSALRVLYLQNDIADTVISILKGAMKELKIGEPQYLETDIGPVIDGAAKAELDRHMEYIEKHGKLLFKTNMEGDVSNNSRLFMPVAFEIPDIGVLKEEVFGPVLHIIRFEADELESVIDHINATGYGLTCGLHSRIQSRQTDIADKIDAGNIYINRSMTGAVVGVQPFGGMGQSGTGPKAGGPYYLHAFGTEKVVSTDTTASGGNASLVSLEE